MNTFRALPIGTRTSHNQADHIKRTLSTLLPWPFIYSRRFALLLIAFATLRGSTARGQQRHDGDLEWPTAKLKILQAIRRVAGSISRLFEDARRRSPNRRNKKRATITAVRLNEY